MKPMPANAPQASDENIAHLIEELGLQMGKQHLLTHTSCAQASQMPVLDNTLTTHVGCEVEDVVAALDDSLAILVDA